jgi:homoaconitate hydratase family protein
VTPQSMTHKILARQAGRDHVESGEFIEAEISMCFSHDPGVAVLTDTFYSGFGADAKVFDPSRVAFFQDHLVPAKDPASRNLAKIMDQFVADQQIQHYFPYGPNYGVSHNVLIENGLTLPGELIVGNDSHTVTGGAFNALATGVGIVDLASVLKTGRLWFSVPRVMQVRIDGNLRQDVQAMDIMLRLLSDIKMGGASGMAIEWAGSTIDELTLDQRTSLCNMVVEGGAMNGIMSVQPIVEDYLRSIAKRPYEPVTADPGAEYDTVVQYRAEDIEPMVALPHKPDNGVPLRDVADGDRVKVDQVYVGGCAGGKLEDIAIFTDVIRGNRIADQTHVVVVPATMAIYRAMALAGITRDLVLAGANVESPGCKACFGAHGAVLGDGDVCLATINRNFRGRMGSPNASVFLGSPWTAGQTALRGYITDGS